MVAWRHTPRIPALGDKGSRIKSSRSYLTTSKCKTGLVAGDLMTKRKSKSIMITKC